MNATNTTSSSSLTLSKTQRRYLLVLTAVDCLALTAIGVCGLLLFGYSLTDIPDASAAHEYHIALWVTPFCIVFTMVYGLIISLLTRRLRHVSNPVRTGWYLTALSVISPLLPVVFWLCSVLIASLIFHGRSEVSGNSIWALVMMSAYAAMFVSIFLVYGFAIRAAVSSWHLLHTTSRATA